MSDTSYSSRLAEWGRGLLSGGYVLLAVGIGIGIGYWAADWQARWLPTMVRNVLILWIAGFALLAWGARLVARASRDEGSEGKPPASKRAAAFVGLSVACGLGVIVVMIAARKTPLTEMGQSEFRFTHEADARYFRDLDRNLQTIVALLERQQDLFQSRTERTLTPEQERLVLDAWSSYLDTALALEQIRRFHEDFYGFDLSRSERVRHVRSFLLSFAAELSLYENTTRIVDVLSGNANVVRFLNIPRDERSIDADSVAKVREELAGLTDLSRVAAGRRYLSYLERVHQGRIDAVAEQFDWLWRVVDGYVAAVERRRNRDMVALAASSDFAPIMRQLKHASFPIQKGIAEWMGDVRVKRVGHYLVSMEQAQVMQQELSPGDVLLSRKNWYLSNIGLPGFWPHAMLYVGTTQQMRETFDGDASVSAWVFEQTGSEMTFTDYLASKYPVRWRRRNDVSEQRAPFSVIEAVSEGVIQSTLYSASGDFIVGLRPRVPMVVKARAIARAFSYLERPYDFDFDFATDHALVCTEVVWRSYRPEAGLGGLELTPIPVAGRMTLPANEIAKTFRDEFGQANAQFDFVYYLEGREEELAAVVSDRATFLETPSRPKWDFGEM